MIVLVATPRSGSTLMYQILCHSFSGYYLSNLSHLLYKLPLIGGVISGIICNHHVSDFKSTNGFVGGLTGPAEGLHFWQYWFGCGLSEAKNKQSQHLAKHINRRRYLHKVFSLLGKPHKPIITGYLGHLICLDEMIKEFPKAIYIKLNRDPVDNTMSILKSKQPPNEFGRSVFPEECDPFDENVIHQTTSQVYWLNKKLDQLDADRVFTIRYEELCDRPQDTMQSLLKFCNSCGLDLSLRAELKDRFLRKEPNQSKETEAVIEQMKKLQSKHNSIDVYKEGHYVL